MTADEIINQWEKDAVVDHTELGRESLRISELHHKYYKMFLHERLVKKKLESDMKELRLAKHEFYLQGPSKESQEKGWKAPLTRVLRSDLQVYMDADTHMVELNMRIGYQQEKVDLLESIIKIISNRNYALKNAIDFVKFTSGAG